MGRWVHVDSCEAAYDTPLLYEGGWGKALGFVLAASWHGHADVTRWAHNTLHTALHMAAWTHSLAHSLAHDCMETQPRTSLLDQGLSCTGPQQLVSTGLSSPRWPHLATLLQTLRPACSTGAAAHPPGRCDGPVGDAGADAGHHAPALSPRPAAAQGAGRQGRGGDAAAVDAGRRTHSSCRGPAWSAVGRRGMEAGEGRDRCDWCSCGSRGVRCPLTANVTSSRLIVSHRPQASTRHKCMRGAHVQPHIILSSTVSADSLGCRPCKLLLPPRSSQPSHSLHACSRRRPGPAVCRRGAPHRRRVPRLRGAHRRQPFAGASAPF